MQKFMKILLKFDKILIEVYIQGRKELPRHAQEALLQQHQAEAPLDLRRRAAALPPLGRALRLQRAAEARGEDARGHANDAHLS